MQINFHQQQQQQQQQKKKMVNLSAIAIHH